MEGRSRVWIHLRNGVRERLEHFAFEGMYFSCMCFFFYGGWSHNDRHLSVVAMAAY